MTKKNNFLINNQVAYPFFISNEFNDFLESIWILSIFCLKRYFKKSKKINLKIHMDSEKSINSFKMKKG